jgi:glycogen debranching enzyme
VSGTGIEQALAERARATLATNDMGSFFRPGPEIYPFQWNWDSALIAIGLARVDAERGRAEIRSLLRGQWDDGMVPHIVFHVVDPDYVPGPELWSSRACPSAPDVPTSGITQPPVLATAVRVLHEAEPDVAFLEEVVPRLERWHRWLHDQRGADGGLVAVFHPWEAADNSPRFDEALSAIPDNGPEPPRHGAAEERPTDADYRRYLALVERLRAHEYRPPLAGAPFVYPDLTFNAVLAVAEEDLAVLWRELGEDATRAAAAASRLHGALAGRSDGYETIDSLLPLYAGAADARRVYDDALWSPERFGPSAEAPWAVTTTSKASAAFDPRRYWRGPVWINVNWFLVRGLERSGLAEEAGELRRMTLELVDRSGFAEYYDPRNGEPLGSRSFSWSAALTLDLL